MASLIAWFLLRRQRSRSRTRSRPPPSASESGGEVEYDAAEAEGEGRGKPTESVGQLTVVASRGESPERKFPKIVDGALGYPSPHLTVNHLPLPASSPSCAPEGVSSATFAGRPVSNAGVLGNGCSGAYAPGRTKWKGR